MAALVDDAEVAHVEPVRIVYPVLAQGVALMNAGAVRVNYNGAGMSIAICDTGIDCTHPMLGGAPPPSADSRPTVTLRASHPA